MPFKHLSLERSKQQVLGVELARLSTPGGEVPLVATAEAERLTLWWWSRGEAAWQSWTWSHRPLAAHATSAERAGAWSWSRRVGLAAGDGVAALVFKRAAGDDGERGALYVALFRAGADSLAPAGPPRRVPLAALGIGGTGLDLHAEWVGGELVVLAQTLEDPATGAGARLSLLSTAARDLEDPAAWRVAHLGEGGHDFDALRDGAELHVVHRARAAALRIPFRTPSRGTGFPSSSSSPPALAPEPVVVGLGGAEAGAVLGGEHPQIQALSPRALAFDRVRGGHFVVRGGPLPELVPVLGDAAKVLAVRGPEGWKTGMLESFDPGALPRTLAPLAHAHHLAALSLHDAGGAVELSTLFGVMPLHPARVEERPMDKTLEVAFLHHSQRLGALLLSHHRVAAGGEGLAVEAVGTLVADLNHEPIRASQAGPRYEAENQPFAPFRLSGSTLHEDGFLVALPRRVDNTIGVLLRGDRGAGGTAFHAYADGGDGGARVVHAPGLEVPPPAAPPRPKLLDPGMVPGLAGPDAAWVRIPQGPLPLPAGLPGYPAVHDLVEGLAGLVAGLAGEEPPPPRSLASRLHVVLETLGSAARLVGVSPPDDPAVRLTDADFVAIEDYLVALAAQAEAVASGGDQPFPVRFTRGSALVFAGSVVTLRAGAAPVPDAAFTWSFDRAVSLLGGPSEVTEAAGAAVDAVLPAGPVRITLKVRLPDGTTSEAGATVEVQAPLAATVWGVHDAINASPGVRVGDLSVSLLRYRLDFRTATPARPRDVALVTLPAFDAEMSFHGATGQGRVRYALGIGASTADVRLGGGLAWLNAVVEVRSVAVRLLYGRDFTPCVLTSDRRHHDPLLGRPYAAAAEQGVGTGEDFETVRRGERMLPAALAAKPAGGSTLRVASVAARVRITPGARNAATLVAALGALGLAGTTVALLLGMVWLVASPLGVPPGALSVMAAAVPLGLAAVVAVLLAAGLAWLFIEVVAPLLLSEAVAAGIRAALRDSEAMRQTLDAQGLLTYAGEGLAESLARMAASAAAAAGLPVDPPGPEAGGDRHRENLWEMVVAGDGECRVLVRTRP